MQWIFLLWQQILLQGCMKGQTKINLDLHASDDLAWLLRRLVRNIVMGLWVMALLISSSIICTTDMKPKLWGYSGVGRLWLCVCFYYCFVCVYQAFLFRKIKDGDHLQSLRDGFRLFLAVMELFRSAVITAIRSYHLPTSW